MYKLWAIVLFYCSFGVSQNLEETIYTTAENFILTKKNNTAIHQLNVAENQFKAQVKTKDEQLALVFLQCHKAYYLSKHGYTEDALLTYEDALQRFSNNNLATLSDFDIIENCLIPLSVIYTQTSDFTNAINTINQYLFLAKTNNNIPHQISGAINLAILYQTLGNTKMAIQTVNKALKIKPLGSLQKNKLLNIKIGCLITLAQYNAAIANNNLLEHSTFNQYKNKYLIALKKKQYNKALLYFNKAKALLNDNDISKRDKAKFYVEEAQLHITLNNNTQAITALQNALNILLPQSTTGKVLPNKDLLYPENTFIDIFDMYASLQPNLTLALQYYDLSFYVSHLLQTNWTSQENKIQQQAKDRLRSEACIDLLFRDFEISKNKETIKKAFQYAEKSKVSVLKTMLKKQQNLRLNPNDSLLILEFELLKEQERLTSLLIKEQLEKTDNTKINTYNKLLNTISIELKQTQLRIEKKYPTTAYTFSLESLQKKLKQDHAVLVEYFYGKNTLYQFIINSKTIEIKSIVLTKKVNDNIKRFIHLFDNPSAINNNVSNYTKLAYQLYQSLNLQDVFTTKNTIIIPDGFLCFLPFETLLSAPTNTTVFSNMPFIVKTQTLVYNSSAEFYMRPAPKNTAKKLLGFFPVFQNTAQPLNYSINEADAITKLLHSKLYMKEQATKAYFKAHAKDYDILHLSTHASSGSASTPARIAFYDGPLLLNDLYSLDLNTHLVVLSACETGIGKRYKGEGPMSLARGFQYAGAHSVLFSLWQINDLSTSQVMTHFYTAFLESKSAFMANQASKLNYLEDSSISNIKKSPYYWSSFVFYGTFNPVKNSYLPFYIISGIVLFGFILFLVRRYRYDKRNNITSISNRKRLHQSKTTPYQNQSFRNKSQY